jgi:hypothetical protein
VQLIVSEEFNYDLQVIHVQLAVCCPIVHRKVIKFGPHSNHLLNCHVMESFINFNEVVVAAFVNCTRA